MLPDDLEILITQSLDGLLSVQQQADLDAELARNPTARALFDEYRNLNTLLQSTPLPRLDYNHLSRKISAAISETELPAITYKFPIWTRWAAGVAVAASIALAFGIWLNQPSAPSSNSVVFNPATTAVTPVQVAVLNVQQPINVTPINQISIGPQPGMEKINLPVREALTAPRSAVAIDSALSPRQDTDRPLY